jgi:hypothetical protein
MTRKEFSEKTKREAYELRNGMCPGLVEIRSTCGRWLGHGCEYDHIKRCEIEPDNSLANCRPLCPICHAIKTVLDAKSAAKGRLIRKETKASQRPKAPIRSRNTLTKEERLRAKKIYEARNER